MQVSRIPLKHSAIHPRPRRRGAFFVVHARIAVSYTLIALLLAGLVLLYGLTPEAYVPAASGGYIKWVQFDVPYQAMERALNYDIKSYNTDVQIHWVEVLSYLAAKYFGDLKKYKAKDMDALVTRLKKGERIEDITKDMKFYGYYREAYGAVLDGFVGEYETEVFAEDGKTKVWKKKYGLKVFSPIAKNYGYWHYDDFGDSRTYGFKRLHLGNDLMGGLGTPVVAVESGVIEALGWNMYGGWRIGIRSLDKKRYYYYAHLRKDTPYHTGLFPGKTVQAGEVIGYLGMTGYSTKENVNNVKKPHLHFGMELIFDESQKECVNEIWIDVYNIVKLLGRNRSAVKKSSLDKQYYRVFNIRE